MSEGEERTGEHELRNVIGQETAKRALEVSLAGVHHLLLVGPHGSGKSLLVSCVEGLLAEPLPELVFADDLRSESPRRLQALAGRMEEDHGALLVIGTFCPCPCGRGGLGVGCGCQPWRVRRHWQAIERILHRFAMVVSLDARAPRSLRACGEESAVVGGRIAEARAAARSRQGGLNASLSPQALATHASLDKPATALMEAAREKLLLSLAEFHSTLRIARTVADLARAAEVRSAYIAEALGYRVVSAAEAWKSTAP